MNKSLQVLVAVTCLAVLSAIGWTAYAQRSERLASEEAQRLAVDARSQMQLATCKAEVSAWDAGNRAPAEAHYGKGADQAIDTCRQLIRIDGLRQSTPSE